jgi:hypothetical protein
MDKTIKKNEVFLRYLKQEKETEVSSIVGEDLDYLVEKVTTDLKFSLIPEYDFLIAKNPEMYLFFWCILSNRIQLAKIFWKIGKVILYHIFSYVL